MPKFKEAIPAAQRIVQFAHQRIQHAAQRRMAKVQQPLPQPGVHWGALQGQKAQHVHGHRQNPGVDPIWEQLPNGHAAARQQVHPLLRHQQAQLQQQWAAHQQLQHALRQQVIATQQAGQWQAMQRQAAARFGMHPGQAAPIGLPSPDPSKLQLGTRALSAALEVPQNLQVRKGGELQDLFYNGHLAGVMTRYPLNPQEVADTFRAALKSPHPRVIDLAQPKDVGRTRSYVAELPERVPTKVGDMWLCKETVDKVWIGPNGQNTVNGNIDDTQTRVYVLDPNDQEPSWKPVEHHDVGGWLDGSTPPEETFERLWRTMHRQGIFDQGVVHCAAGIGRTPMLMFRVAFQVYLEDQNRRGHYVTEREADAFIESLTGSGREMRGGFVLPDGTQRKRMIHSCHTAVAAQQPFLAMQPMPRQQHVQRAF